MSPGDKLREAVYEATLQTCPKCGHKRFYESFTRWDCNNNIIVEEDGEENHDFIEGGELGDSTDDIRELYCRECHTQLEIVNGQLAKYVSFDEKDTMSQLAIMTGKMSEAIEEAEQARQDVIKIVENLPDNPAIEKLSKNCIVIPFKEVDVQRSLHPTYYDFKQQYKMITSRMSSVSLHNVGTFLKSVIDTGWLVLPDKSRFPIHPKVVENLKEVL